MFNWQGPNGFISSQQDINNVDVGTYELIVTEDNNCQNSFSLIISETLWFFLENASLKLLIKSRKEILSGLYDEKNIHHGIKLEYGLTSQLLEYFDVDIEEEKYQYLLLKIQT